MKPSQRHPPPLQTTQFPPHTSRFLSTSPIPLLLLLLLHSAPLLHATNETWGLSSCSTYTTCTSCSSWTSHCHWCSHDSTCHPKGSIYGCAVGSSCADEEHPVDSQTCSDHKTCADCSASSWGCHWCAFDEACHAVGSVHGCATGVNCYAIDRCQRLEPEKLDYYGGTFSAQSFRGVGPVVWGVVGVIFGLVVCCSSLCFGGVTFLKGAVDDLVGAMPEMVEDGMVVNEDYHLLERDREEPEEEQDNLEIALLQNAPHNEDNDDEISDKGDDDENRDNNGFDFVRTEHVSVTNLSRLSMPTMFNNETRKNGGGRVGRMYFACQLCYIFTIVTTIVLSITALSYAHRQPEYNVCTDQLAWKSIVEGMTALKMSASFDLLISVYNPNRWEVDLFNGAGQFHHDGEYVGSFTIPPGQISPQAISDIVVKVTLTPDKWSALSLTSEYYQGTLKFMVGGHSRVKIPGLGYQFDAKFENIEVNPSDPSMDDTHLCACPGWKKPAHKGDLL
ncbi:hypothetical protein HJC23_004886 [Cyclotella cryptica]|uniref:Late embryogenesis abundant protein LEA-2 subgroup domain-containing protein n=1 Tax=Cyclotella cryptica TaxID=29204 RepID=A0ABD3P4C2_9STRA|eukprot:CCRYP_017542-RA/>CCRYP_017542-RA protein AED:0.07 eAED:0.07 QI:131/-1/1/1/-1/1/1/165/503